MLVMRKANKEDVNYCYKLIISNVKHGHFDNALNNLVNRFIFKMRMAKWIKSHTYTNPYEKSDIMKTQICQFYIFEENGQKVGFSAIKILPFAIEIWLIAVEHIHQNKGFGGFIIDKTISTSAENFLKDKMFFGFYVRCYKQSEVIISKLKKMGFKKGPESNNHVIFSKEYTRKAGA